MEVKDALQNSLKGEALSNALDLVDFLTQKGLTPIKEWDAGYRFVKNEKSPCLLVLLDGGEWFICDLPVATEPEWNALDDNLKEFVISNIKTCNVHEGNPCGCGNEPGLTKNIFGKEYENICTSEIQIINPTRDVLDKYKEVVEWWVANIGA